MMIDAVEIEIRPVSGVSDLEGDIASDRFHTAGRTEGGYDACDFTRVLSDRNVRFLLLKRSIEAGDAWRLRDCRQIVRDDPDRHPHRYSRAEATN